MAKDSNLKRVQQLLNQIKGDEYSFKTALAGLTDLDVAALPALLQEFERMYAKSRSRLRSDDSIIATQYGLLKALQSVSLRFTLSFDEALEVGAAIILSREIQDGCYSLHGISFDTHNVQRDSFLSLGKHAMPVLSQILCSGTDVNAFLLTYHVVSKLRLRALELLPSMLQALDSCDNPFDGSQLCSAIAFFGANAEAAIPFLSLQLKSDYPKTADNAAVALYAILGARAIHVITSLAKESKITLEQAKDALHAITHSKNFRLQKGVVRVPRKLEGVRRVLAQPARARAA